MRKTIRAGISLLLLFFSCAAFGQIKLPRLISDGMVLQQGVPANIWGWASPLEAISVEFADTKYKTTANEAGEWKIALNPLPAGGPHQMVLKGKNTLTVSNILMGEVWVCSGQSNMELPMRRVIPLYGADIANAENNLIRQFTVPQRYDFSTPQSDLPSGTWEAATPESVLDFSATAYFFALEIYQKYKVPIGLIHTSLGGSPAEAWMSESALGAFPNLLNEAKKFRDPALIQQIESGDKLRIHAWYDLLRQKDEGYKKIGQPWFDPALDVSDWKKMGVPGDWADAGNGVVWFRKQVQIPAELSGLEAKLELGRIVDADSVFLNGVFIATTSYQYPPRWYTIPAGLLKSGANSLVVRVINSLGKGGFVRDKPYEIVIGNQKIDLKGEWHYRRGATMEPLASQTFIRWKPLGLYNAMLHPLLNYRIKGVIWYQGESNVSRWQEYRRLFPAMITDWRTHWQQGDFPFLFVQLANFLEAKPLPVESNWALLREAQLKTLSVPQTGMAVTIDIGEWNDIHPLNKKDVGRRLALAAQAVAYHDKKTVFSGPVFQSIKIKDSNAILTFSKGDKLTSKEGQPLKGFAIAGADGQFVWADAHIKKNKIMVSNSGIPNPVAVRYAWADNPEGANLYNKAGLPASPFRTDAYGDKGGLTTGLKDYYKNYFPIGTAVNPRMMEPGDDANLILAHFNSMTAENAMKMGPVHPEENRYNWAPADKIADFAVKHGLKLRGHALCWHQQTPNWFFVDSEGKEVSKEVLLARLRQHIFEVVRRYKGKIYAWDVVNEAVPDGGTELYRKSKFYEIIGESYIEKAFEYAHEADPDALLFYNDYNTENASKRERIYQLVKQLKEKGVPIHGVGLQGHWSIYEPTAEELETSITRFAELGLQVHITELDVSVYPKEHERRERRPDDVSQYTPEMEKRQADHYQMLFEIFRKHKDKVTSVTFWNLSDKSSWLDNFPVTGRKDYPLLFDQNNQPKKAYESVVSFK